MNMYHSQDDELSIHKIKNASFFSPAQRIRAVLTFIAP
jgi:hypothetical protein